MDDQQAPPADYGEMLRRAEEAGAPISVTVVDGVTYVVGPKKARRPTLRSTRVAVLRISARRFNRNRSTRTARPAARRAVRVSSGSRKQDDSEPAPPTAWRLALLLSAWVVLYSVEVTLIVWMVAAS